MVVLSMRRAQKPVPRRRSVRQTGPRSFDAYGVMLSMQQVSHEWLVYGVVPDHVRGVRVDGRDAVLANNTFLARVPRHPQQMVLTLTDSERTGLSLRLLDCRIPTDSTGGVSPV